MKLTRLLLVLVAPLCLAQEPYKTPPEVVLRALQAPDTPTISVSPARTHAILAELKRYPPISELAAPMLRLAGIRINPRTNDRFSPIHFAAYELLDLSTGEKTRLQTPPGARLSSLEWSPDGSRFAFLNASTNSLQLWSALTASPRPQMVADVSINGVWTAPIQWLPDNRTVLATLVPAGRGAPPAAPEAPLGPVVQEGAGESGPVRTYQDLLKNSHDEELFDYYATAQAALIDIETGSVSPIGEPGVLTELAASPSGNYFLVERLLKPYSFLHPYFRFPHQVAVWDREGVPVAELAQLPLADKVPIQGVPTGPRSHSWHATEPHTVVWVEALDGGDPKKEAEYRDQIFSLDAPFSNEPKSVVRLGQRFVGMGWLETGKGVLVRDYDVDERWVRTFLVEEGEDPEVLWSLSAQDSYGDPGTPVQRIQPNGHSAIVSVNGKFLLDGVGSSPQGDRPFIDQFDLAERRSERMFRSDENSYENTVVPLNDSGTRLLTRYESPDQPPNYRIRDTVNDTVTELTHYTDPLPELRHVAKRLVTYEREDGVPLSFTLYLPPGYKEGEDAPLPTVFWAYPREFNTADTAGQVRGSTKRFTTLLGPSHLFLLTQGYAILDGATLPVVGDALTANDTYVEQIVAGAKAAIDKAASLGVSDPARVGAGGHSYGAFMTANLLAHSDLFRAGIARSGAYNRTLTPFGFQSERRTFWEAPEIYYRMSPFMNADKINEPLLLIHGEADNNSGTFPIQSERMYEAMRGNGGTVRFVMLPHESHGYAAMESVGQTLAEMIEWFDRFVKNVQP